MYDVDFHRSYNKLYPHLYNGILYSIIIYWYFLTTQNEPKHRLQVALL